MSATKEAAKFVGFILMVVLIINIVQGVDASSVDNTINIQRF